MEIIRKSFFQSKIIIGGLIMFIAGTVQAITGYYVQPDVLTTAADTITGVANGQTISGSITALLGLYITIQRVYLTSDQIEKVWYKSGIFLAGLFGLITQVVYYQTGVQIPAELSDGILDQLILLLNGGDIIPFIMQVFPAIISLWRMFNTTTEVTTFQPVKSALTLYSRQPLKQAA